MPLKRTGEMCCRCANFLPTFSKSFVCDCIIFDDDNGSEWWKIDAKDTRAIRNINTNTSIHTRRHSSAVCSFSFAPCVCVYQKSIWISTCFLHFRQCVRLRLLSLCLWPLNGTSTNFHIHFSSFSFFLCSSEEKRRRRREKNTPKENFLLLSRSRSYCYSQSRAECRYTERKTLCLCAVSDRNTQSVHGVQFG